MSILKQSKPAAATNDYYAATDYTQGSVRCCNQSASPTTIQLAFVPNGDNLVDQDKHYVYYNVSLPAYGMMAEPFELDPNDRVYFQSASGSVSFSVIGLLGVN